jgi:hypothetical protein
VTAARGLPFSGLRDELEAAQAQVDALQRRLAAATCAEAGCDMQFIGGRNAGCGDHCNCSVPVHQCSRCGDCDYGDNAEAAETIERCEKGELSWETLG